MIVNVVKGWVKPEFKEIFLKHMADLAPIVRAEKGCIAYEQNISAENGLELLLYEEWESREDIIAHINSPHMQEHLAEARPWFEQIEMRTYEVTPSQLFED